MRESSKNPILTSPSDQKMCVECRWCFRTKRDIWWDCTNKKTQWERVDPAIKACEDFEPKAKVEG